MSDQELTGSGNWRDIDGNPDEADIKEVGEVATSSFSRTVPINVMSRVPATLRQLGIALIILTGVISIGATPVAADHANNPCENHHEEESALENTLEKAPVAGSWVFSLDDAVDHMADTWKQNQCNGAGNVNDPFGVPEYGEDRGDSMYTSE